MILGSGLLFDALTDQPRGGLVQRTNAHHTRPHSAFKLENTLALERAPFANAHANHEGQCAGMARASGLKADDSQLTRPRTSPNLSLENQRYGGKCSANMLDASILKATANGTNRECKVPSAALAHALERNGRSPSIAPDAGATLNQCRVERAPCDDPGAPAMYDRLAGLVSSTAAEHAAMAWQLLGLYGAGVGAVVHFVGAPQGLCDNRSRGLPSSNAATSQLLRLRGAGACAQDKESLVPPVATPTALVSLVATQASQLLQASRLRGGAGGTISNATISAALGEISLGLGPSPLVGLALRAVHTAKPGLVESEQGPSRTRHLRELVLFAHACLFRGCSFENLVVNLGNFGDDHVNSDDLVAVCQQTGSLFNWTPSTRATEEEIEYYNTQETPPTSLNAAGARPNTPATQLGDGPLRLATDGDLLQAMVAQLVDAKLEEARLQNEAMDEPASDFETPRTAKHRPPSLDPSQQLPNALPAEPVWHVGNNASNGSIVMASWNNTVVPSRRPVHITGIEKTISADSMLTIFHSMFEMYQEQVGIPQYDGVRATLMNELVRLYLAFCAARGVQSAHDGLLTLLRDCGSKCPQLGRMVFETARYEMMHSSAEDAILLLLRRLDECMTVRSSATVALSYAKAKWETGASVFQVFQMLSDRAFSCFPDLDPDARRQRSVERFLILLQAASEDPSLSFQPSMFSVFRDRWVENCLLSKELGTLVREMQQHSVGSHVLAVRGAAATTRMPPATSRQVGVLEDDEGGFAGQELPASEVLAINGRANQRPALNHVEAVRAGAFGSEALYMTFNNPTALHTDPKGLSGHHDCLGCIAAGVTETLSREELLKLRLADKNFKLGAHQCLHHRPHRCTRLKAHLEAWVKTDEGAAYAHCLEDAPPAAIQAAERALGFTVVTFER